MGSRELGCILFEDVWCEVMWWNLLMCTTLTSVGVSGHRYSSLSSLLSFIQILSIDCHHPITMAMVLSDNTIHVTYQNLI